MAIAAAFLFILCRKRRANFENKRKREDSNEWPDEFLEKPGELSGNSTHEVSQLDTREAAVELPAGYGVRHEIGRAF